MNIYFFIASSPNAAFSFQCCHCFLLSGGGGVTVLFFFPAFISNISKDDTEVTSV